MKATFIGREANESKFKMEFTAEEFEAAINKSYQENKGKFSVDGFRKGKAPRRLIEAAYGADVFFEDAIGDLFSDSYAGTLVELNVNPVDRPNADFSELKQGQGFEVTITVTVAPEVEVKDYKGVKTAKVDDTVTDEDVAKELETLQKRNGRLVNVEREVKDGDTVILDFAGFVGDEQFAGGTAENQELVIGSGQFIPGFEEQLVGAKIGEDVDVNVTFPKEYQAEELAGKDAVFKCKVHEVKEMELAELNDEFAKDVSEFDTLEEMKADIRTKAEETKKQKAEYEMHNAVLADIYKNNEFDVPDCMIKDETTDMLNELAQQLQYEGLKLEDYLNYLQKSLDELRENMKPEATQKVKTKLLVNAIAKKEGLTVSEEELDEEIGKMAAMYKQEKEELKKNMGIDGVALLKRDLENQKALNFVFENAIYE